MAAMTRSGKTEPQCFLGNSALFTAILLAALTVCVLGPIEAQAEDPPTLAGIECYSTNLLYPGWSNTVKVKVALEGDGGAPLWVDIDEDPDFGSPSTIDYQNFSEDPVIQTIKGHTDDVNCAVFSPDGNKVLTGSSDKTAKIWTLYNGKAVLSRSHSSAVNAVAYSPDLRLITTGCLDVATVWNALTGDKIFSQSRYAGHINCLTFSSDSGLVFSGGDAAIVSMYDISRKLHIRSFSGHDGSIKSVVVSPDMTKVLTGSLDGTVKIWERATAKELRTIFVYGFPVNAVAFSQDSSKVLTGSADSIARIWDANTGQDLITFSGHTDQITSVAFSPDNTKVLTGSADTTAKLWDAQTGALLRTFTGHTGAINSVAFSPDGLKMLTASDDDTAQIWALRSGYTYSLESGDDGLRTVYVRLRNHAGSSQVVSAYANLDTHAPVILGRPEVEHGNWSFNPVVFTWPEAVEFGIGVADYECQIGTSPGASDIFDGLMGDALSKMVAGDVGQTFYCRVRATDRIGHVGPWTESNGVFISDTQLPNLDGTTVAGFFSDNEEMTTTLDVIVALDWTQGLPRWVEIDEDSNFGSPTVWDYNDRWQRVRTFAGHKLEVLAVAFSPDGKYVLTGSGDGTARLWDKQSGALVRTFTGQHVGKVSSVAFSADGTKVLTGSDDMTARMWDARQGTQIRVFHVSPTPVYAVAFNPDASRVLTGNGKYAVIWDAQTGAIIRTLQGHKDEVRSVAFNPYGNLVLTGSADKVAKLWDAQFGNEIYTLEGHSSGVMSAVFSPDSLTMATGSLDGTVRLWNTSDGAQIGTLIENLSEINSVTFSPDGAKVLMGCSDSTARLCDVQSGVERMIFSGHTQAINGVAFSPDGKQILTGSADTTAGLWGAQHRFAYRLDSGANGLRTVYVRLRNNLGLSQEVNDSIMLNLRNAAGGWMLYE